MDEAGRPLPDPRSEPLPEPPPARGRPTLIELPPAAWWRVHPFDPATGRFGPARFNDSGLGDARFSPLWQAPGGAAGPRRQPAEAAAAPTLLRTPVPTLYAAATVEGALMETVLREVPTPSQGHLHDLQRDLDAPLRLSQVELAEPLQVVDLTKLGLQRMGLRPSQLFETDADDYPRTRRWADWLRAAAPAAQGLLWLSARQPESRAVMLFGDRIRRGAVKVGDVRLRPLHDPRVLAVLLGLLQRLGCGVAPDR
jgi:hypothetical protein